MHLFSGSKIEYKCNHHCMYHRGLKRDRDEERVKDFLSIEIALNFINFEF